MEVTMLPTEAQPEVVKTFVEDVSVTYKPDRLTIIVDADTFASKVEEQNEYTFEFHLGRWTQGNSPVNLNEYGITISAGTPVENDFFKIYYGQHGNFNLNIPRGETGDVNFMTFDINPSDGQLYMYKPTDLTQIEFEIIDSGLNEGCLAVTVNSGGQ